MSGAPSGIVLQPTAPSQVAGTHQIDPNAPTPDLDASLAYAKAPVGPVASVGWGANDPIAPTQPKAKSWGDNDPVAPTLESKGELGAARTSGALQGALLGFGDEALGAFSATADQLGIGHLLTGEHDPHSWGEDYEKYRDIARRQYEEYRQERPWESFGTTAAGAILTAPLIGAGGKAITGVVAPTTAKALAKGTATLAQRATEGVVTGGAAGGTAGYGAGEGGIENRLTGGAIGAGTGGVIGGGAPIVGKTVFGPVVNWLGARLGLMNPEQRAAELLGQHISQSSPSGQTPNLSATVRNLASAGTSRGRVPLAIADLNESTRSMAGAVSRRPGQARDILTDWASERQLGNPTMGLAGGGQWSGMLDDIAETVSPSTSAKDAAKRIIDARAAASKPLYDAFRQLGPLSSPELKELAQIPTLRSAIQQGRDLAQMKGALSSRTPYDPNSTALPGEVWHYAKMALDDAISAARREGANAKVDALVTLQKRLLAELDRVSGGLYGKARNAFAGPSALLDALEEGQQILTKGAQPEDIVAQVRGLTAGEREMYLAGVAQALRNLAMNTSRQNNAGAQVINVPAVSEKLRAAFGNWQQFTKFMQRIGARSEQFKTFAEIMKGSPTATRLAADDALAQGIEQGAPNNAVMAYAQGGRHGLLKWFSDHLNNAGDLLGVSEKVRVALAKMLISDNPAAIKRAAQMIDDAVAAAQSRQRIGSTIRRGAVQGAVVGALTGKPGAAPQPAPAPKGPPVGSVVNGYRFGGGDPNDQRAWEPTN